MIGKTFGTYRVEEKLGEGGMGVVYRAIDTELDRPVALKTLISKADAESVARFLREAKAASRLQHPAIVTIHHFGVEGDVRYIVMELVEGRTLKEIIGGRPLQAKQICDIATQVVDGLAAAHDKGIVHRDIKAENIILTSRGQVKILDFGLAKLRDVEPAADQNTVYHTQVGVVMGTVSHMSPEQALGKEVDARSDIFSFGVVLYEMATGKTPFNGPNPQAIMAKILNQVPDRVTAMNPQIPLELEHLIEECIEKDRAMRPSAEEIVSRLKTIRASLTSGGFQPASGSAMKTQLMPKPSGAVSSAAPAAARPSAASAAAGRLPSGRYSAAVHAAATPELKPRTSTEMAGLRVRYLTLLWLRRGLGLLLLLVPFSFLVYFIIAGGLIKPHVFASGVPAKLMEVMKFIVVPTMAVAEKVLAFKTSVGNWNFLLLGMGVVSFVLRQVVLLPLEKLEAAAKDRMVRAVGPGGRSGAQMVSADGAASHRMSMLREYAEAKKFLFQEKRHLSFLAIDVVGSTKMKIGEDKLVIEHAFAEYKRFIERILTGNNVWKVAWTPDGIMCAFFSVNEAVRAGQEVLSQLPWFNDGVHQLRTKFHVRCGVNSGDVVFPEEKNMEDVSDENVDIAGHMQKYAAPDSLWLSREVFEELANPEGFVPVENQKVDGHFVFAWSPGQQQPQQKSGPAASASAT